VKRTIETTQLIRQTVRSINTPVKNVITQIVSIVKIHRKSYRQVDSARELVMIKDEPLIGRRFTADSVDIYFILHELLKH